MLGVERVKVLLKLLVGRDAVSVAQRTVCQCGPPFSGLSRRPKNLGPFQRVPVMANATCDRLGYISHSRQSHRNARLPAAFDRSIHGRGRCRAARPRYAELNPRRSVQPSQASPSGRAGAGSHCPNPPNDRPGAGRPRAKTAGGDAGERAPVARKLRANGCEARRRRDHVSA